VWASITSSSVRDATAGSSMRCVFCMISPNAAASRTPSRRAFREQTALYQFTDRLQRAESLDDVYELALDAILGALQCSRASILLRDGSGAMRFAASRGLSEPYRHAVDGHSPWIPTSETRSRSAWMMWRMLHFPNHSSGW